MDLGIKGKNVLITGASQGIGKAIALEFAKEGCKVSVIARREEELKQTVLEMGGKEKGHDHYAIDLMEDGAPEKAVKALIKRNGDYDIVVHNIGGTLGVKDILSPMDEWLKVVKFNVGVSIDINRIVVPPMQKKKWGRIINISSISGIELRGSAPYGAAKAYCNAYTKVLGRALAPDGIVVSAVLPGAIYAPGGHWDEDNPMNQKDLDAFLRKRSDFLRHHHAIGRLGTAEEIAPFVVFMASKQVTFAPTTLIPVDGGTM